jgi:hypothetical protein
VLAVQSLTNLKTVSTFQKIHVECKPVKANIHLWLRGVASIASVERSRDVTILLSYQPYPLYLIPKSLQKSTYLSNSTVLISHPSGCRSCPLIFRFAGRTRRRPVFSTRPTLISAN